MLRSTKRIKRTVSLVLGLALVFGSIPPLASAANNPGMPVFKSSGAVIPQEPAAYSPEQSMMQAIYDMEKNGTDFWIDRLLARPGNDPAREARGVDLMTRGRALYMKEHTPGLIGFAGRTAYQDVLGGNAYTVTFTGLTLTEDVGKRLQMPSHWRSEHNAQGLSIVQRKFITDSNAAVTLLDLINTGTEAKTVTMTVNPSFVSKAEGDELTGVVNSARNLTKINTRLSGSGMTAADNKLTRTISIPAGATLQANVVMGFITAEIPESLTEYNVYKSLNNDAALAKQTQDYNKWWADNVPYIDVPDENIKKIAYYRWWLNRFNYLDANIPGNDFQFPTSIEGVLGYNNAIVLTQPMHIQDLQYLRNPMYSYGNWVSVGETSNGGAFTDNPGMPDNWNNYYTQYLSEAAWNSYKIHGGQSEIIGNLAHYAEKDVAGQLFRFDKNNNGVIAYDWGALTGNDADAVSFHWKSGNQERAEGAYVYGGAKAAAEMYGFLGNEEKEAELGAIAADIQQGIMEELWDEEDQVFKHRHISTDELNPWKEINNYYPFTEGVPPNEEKYKEAFRLWQDSAEYPIFPFFTANQKDKAAAAAQGEAGSNNFSTINSTVTFRLFAKALREYPSEYITADMYKQLLYWVAWAQYYDGDTRYPDANEFWANWNPATQKIDYRSWIHHNILGNYNYTLIEDVAGLRPRLDKKIELWPLDIGWDHFTVNNLNYHDQDLTIVWDKPGDGATHYGTAPEGYSVFIDGERAFTADKLVQLVWDPETGKVEFPGDDGTALYEKTMSELKEAKDVALTDGRVIDMFQKAGIDLDPETAAFPNLAAGEGVQQSASFNAAGTKVSDAVDGFTISGTSKPREAAFTPPIWGSKGSPNATDWYEIDFGKQTAFDNVKLYFYNDRVDSGGYSEPSMYKVEYFDGSNWLPALKPYKLPKIPQANLNEVQFPAVTASKMRVTMTHKGANKTALKEIQVYHTGIIPPVPVNEKPEVTAALDSGPKLPLQAKLIGSAVDDGLPEGVVTVNWSKLSGPGDVVFANPKEGNTTATFTAAGTYTLKFEATDGELSSETELTVIVEPLPSEINVATFATPKTSFVSSWETVTAVNDGLDWPNSNPPNGVSAGGIPRYGNWSQQGTQWVEYTWSEPVKIGKASVSWMDDGGGVKLPASWKLQYWDGSKLVDVAEPTAYGLAKNGYNHVQFKPVTTTKLRIVMVSNNASTGILEWKVFAEPPVSANAVKIPTLVGEQPQLPAKIEQTYADGSTQASKVTWFPIDPELLQNPGSSFKVTGIIEGSTLQAEASVYVRVTNAVQVTNITDIHAVTAVGKAPVLPAAADVLYNDGSWDNVNNVIAWDAIAPESYAQIGEFIVEGAIAASTTKVKAYVSVTGGTVTEVGSVQVTTSAGVAPNLPAKVTVTYEGGATAEVPVVWDAIAPAAYAQPGTFKVNGTVAVTAKKAEASVTVTEAQGTAAVTLSGPEKIEGGEAFHVILGISGAEQSVYAEDITIAFDADKLEWLGAEDELLNEHFALVGEDQKDGEIRLITAKINAAGSDVNGPLAKLMFKAKDTDSGAMANISITKAAAADAAGLETELEGAGYSIQINGVNKAVLRALIADAQQVHDAAVEGTKVGEYPAGSKAALLAAIQSAQAIAVKTGVTSAQIEQAVQQLNDALQLFKASVNKALPGDVSGDDKVSVGDLAIVAVSYGKTSAHPQWEQIKKADMNKDGKIDIEDLAALARLILG
ncbi:Ig-like domain-containing protein [Paenibacillus sp. LPE1-1-1.1]|uniref:Ig-like domain-containing protein n=1 Tax=Paenibacillus sp. LPE1-1-1.1 TaxID=3135230 RepID=UPI00342B2129